jgi:hypothetical protein
MLANSAHVTITLRIYRAEAVAGRSMRLRLLTDGGELRIERKISVSEKVEAGQNQTTGDC